MRDELLLYYENELNYLRQLGAEFGQKYPKIAGRLILESDKCDDPHVERLLEAFAFLCDQYPPNDPRFKRILMRWPGYRALATPLMAKIPEECITAGPPEWAAAARLQDDLSTRYDRAKAAVDAAQAREERWRNELTPSTA